jgi:hypothetical protein
MLHHMLRAAAQRAFNVLDPYFQYVTMLLHGDGTNGAQNNTFLDSSTNNFTITRNGNTTQGTFSPYGSNWSNFLDGSSFLTFPYTSNYEWTASDFTVEAWVFPTSLTNWSYNNSGFLHSTMIGNHSTTGVQDTWSFGPLSDGRVGFYYFSGGQQAVYSTATVTANQWSHVAMTKTSSGITIFVNGVGTTATAVTGTPATDNYGMVIGKSNGTALNGYVSNARIVKGTAVYSGTSYTVPTVPLTAITNTQFLSCQSNRFIDNSTNAATITVNGTPSVQRFSPFSPTTAYSTSVIGGSGYFDGSGDYLSAPSNSAFGMGTGDFTVETWIYFTAAQAEKHITDSNASSGLFLKTNATNVGIGRAMIGEDTMFNYSFSQNVWYHIAFARSGSTVYGFVNGVQIGSATNTNSYATGACYVGAASDGSRSVNGYISNLRIVKGTAVYTSAFTPSTTPLTAITNTSLLLNYTNAGILDNAMMNDLETVGNAQISTSVKKYGTGSMYFDGTGDNLNIPVNENTNFGSGNFTIEGWLYLNTTGVYQVFFSRTLASVSGYGGTWLRVTDTNVLQAAFSSGTTAHDFTITCSTALSASTWYHVAYVRNGSAFNIYLNGTSNGSATSSATMYSAGTTVTVGVQTNSNSAFGYLNGYIDDLRITKGVARYTANFTAPTAAFPNN